MQLLFLGRSPREHFEISQEISEALPVPSSRPVLSQFLFSWRQWQYPGGRLSLQLQFVQKFQQFVSNHDPAKNSLEFVSNISCHFKGSCDRDGGLCQDVLNTALVITRQVQVVRQNFVPSSEANLCLLRLRPQSVPGGWERLYLLGQYRKRRYNPIFKTTLTQTEV